jgi:hypothetical protein
MMREVVLGGDHNLLGRAVTDHSSVLTATAEFPDDAQYAWWCAAHPTGFILAVRAKQGPILHRVRCPEVDRDRHPGRLKAKGSRQICADVVAALRAWVTREIPEASTVLTRCPKCAP